jgi:exosome complex RNA-binding protein Rrp4
LELVRVLGLVRKRLARRVIGMTFDLRNLLACALGIAVLLGVDGCVSVRPKPKPVRSRATDSASALDGEDEDESCPLGATTPDLSTPCATPEA